MPDKNLTEKIHELQQQLVLEEERYKMAVRSQQTYNTLKAIRNGISKIKERLLQLYSSDNG